MEAIRSDSLGDLLLLLQIGVNASSKTATGRTALHVAAANDPVYILNKLLPMGLDVCFAMTVTLWIGRSSTRVGFRIAVIVFLL